jgi:(E)-4-hydroxy-3-methylbut-2-enyl-diphosphate synthase
VFIGDKHLDFEVPGTLGVICSIENWTSNYSNKQGYYPLLHLNELETLSRESMCFITIDPTIENDYTKLNQHPKAVIIINTAYSNITQLYRYIYFIFAELSINNPVIFKITDNSIDPENYQLNVSSSAGSLFIDGFGDGLMLTGEQPQTLINSTAFGILQATRTRISKTEYISCPSCGRTLFDLQETTAKIRKETSHLKGIKIGIMGCIVNGPGEMADADYGYVGTGPGKINLYKEKTVVKKNVPEDDAVHQLIELIKENGDWINPKEA